jgi:dTDP-4-dehydrorhamnose 3,5-epimerase
MDISETEIKGVFVLQLKPFADERGYYKRLWGRDELERLGLDTELNNAGLSKNVACGTVRGMHYQAPPFAETKIVQCVRGRIFDVILDIRRDSATFGKWISVELSPESNQAIYIPKGLAHGFQTLAPDTDVLYFISDRYDKDASRGVRWNDPRFGIKFPLEVSVMNERDANYADFA